MRIILYTQTICPKCKVLKAKLKAEKVDYEEINIDENPDALLDLLMHQISGTPAVRIGEVWLYDPTIEQIKEGITND